MKRFLLFCWTALSVAGGTNARGQTPSDGFALAFRPTVGGQPLRLENASYCNELEQTYSVETFRWYVSNIRFLKKGAVIWAEPAGHHLLDAADERSLTIRLVPPRGLVCDSLAFDVGIDSLTNVSGALGGDLDPTLGMYWTWQSGYINAKIEGFATVGSSPEKEFQYHLGGYSWPNASCRRLRFACPKKSNSLTVEVDLGGFLGKMDFSRNTSVMSPGPAARALSDLLARQFYVR
jgi:hypothetical protein